METPTIRAGVYHPDYEPHTGDRPGSGVVVRVDRNLKSGKLDLIHLTHEQAVDLATDLLEGAKTARRVNADRAARAARGRR